MGKVDRYPVPNVFVDILYCASHEAEYGVNRGPMLDFRGFGLK